MSSSFETQGTSQLVASASGSNKAYYPEEEFFILGLRAGGLSWAQICIVFNQSVSEERRRTPSAIKNKHRHLRQSLQSSLAAQDGMFPPLPITPAAGSATLSYNLYDPALRWPSEMVPHNRGQQNMNPVIPTQDRSASIIRFGGYEPPNRFIQRGLGTQGGER